MKDFEVRVCYWDCARPAPSHAFRGDGYTGQYVDVETEGAIINLSKMMGSALDRQAHRGASGFVLFWSVLGLEAYRFRLKRLDSEPPKRRYQ